MAIVAGDIDFRLSGGSSNSDVNASLGGVKSSTEVTTNVAANLFDHVSGTESAAGDTEYRCIYFHNSHGSLTAQNSKVYITSNTPGAGDQIAIGKGSAAINATEQTVADESTAPSSVTFTEPTDYAGGISLGNIPAGQHQSIWVRRIVAAAAAAVDDNVATLQIGVDTAA
jgi:hypothetical protein